MNGEGWRPLLVAALLFIGCETSVDPVTGTEQAFSFYGVLQPRSDMQ